MKSTVPLLSLYLIWAALLTYLLTKFYQTDIIQQKSYFTQLSALYDDVKYDCDVFKVLTESVYKKLPFDWIFSTLGDIMTALSFDAFTFFATSLKPITVLRFS